MSRLHTELNTDIPAEYRQQETGGIVQTVHVRDLRRDFGLTAATRLKERGEDRAGNVQSLLNVRIWRERKFLVRRRGVVEELERGRASLDCDLEAGAVVGTLFVELNAVV